MGNSEFGLEASIYPNPPEISEEGGVQKSPEEVLDDIRKIVEHLKDLALYEEGFKESMVRNFVSAVAKVPEINVVALFADLVFIVHKLFLGAYDENGSRFELDGVNRQIKLYDSTNTLRVRMGFVGGIPQFQLWGPDGSLTLDIGGLSDPRIQDILDDVPEIIDFEDAIEDFDWDDLENLIPFGRIHGVRITEDLIEAPVVFANVAGFNIVAAGIANILELHANRITVGQFSPERLPDGSQPENIAEAIETAIGEIDFPEDPFSGDYNDLLNQPAIPTSLSQLLGQISGTQIGNGLILTRMLGAQQIVASKMAVGAVRLDSAIVTGTLSANHISADVFNVVILASNAAGVELESRSIPNQFGILLYEYRITGSISLTNSNSYDEYILQIGSWQFLLLSPTNNFYVNYSITDKGGGITDYVYTLTISKTGNSLSLSSSWTNHVEGAINGLPFLSGISGSSDSARNISITRFTGINYPS